MELRSESFLCSFLHSVTQACTTKTVLPGTKRPFYNTISTALQRSIFWCRAECRLGPTKKKRFFWRLVFTDCAVKKN
jgi:hypothetical protein